MTSYVAQDNTGSDALVSSRSVTKPGGVNAGAIGVFWLSRWNEASSFPAVTAPSGAVLRSTVTTTRIETLCYLLKISAETTFAFSWTGGRWSALSAEFFDGVDPALDLAAVPFQSATGTGTSITTLAVTTVNTAALAWHVNTLDGGVASHTPPTGFTEIADVAPWSSAYRISPSDGSQSATGATNNASALWLAGLVALAPASSGSSQALTTAAETGASQPLGTAKSAPVALAAASETALPVQGVKTALLAVASTAEAAQNLPGAKAVTLGVAGGQDAAHPLAGSVAALLGTLQSIEAAQPLTGLKTLALAPAAETDQAQPVVTPHGVPIGSAVEQDTAQGLAGAKAGTVGVAAASETAQILTGTVMRALGTAASLEAAQVFAGSKSAILGAAVETDRAGQLVGPFTSRPSPERTYRIPAERRRRAIPAELRTFAVPAEPRTNMIRR